MGVLDGWRSSKGRAGLGVNVRYPIVTTGILCVRGGDALFPNDWGGPVNDKTILSSQHKAKRVIVQTDSRRQQDIVEGCRHSWVAEVRLRNTQVSGHFSLPHTRVPTSTNHRHRPLPRRHSGSTEPLISFLFLFLHFFVFLLNLMFLFLTTSLCSSSIKLPSQQRRCNSVVSSLMLLIFPVLCTSVHLRAVSLPFSFFLLVFLLVPDSGSTESVSYTHLTLPTNREV